MADQDEIRGNSVYETEQAVESKPADEKPIAEQVPKPTGFMGKSVTPILRLPFPCGQ
jgi:hypothetical protein